MSEALERNEEQTVRDAIPPGYFFKGFLAWSLWGLIHVVKSSTTTKKSCCLAMKKWTLPLEKGVQILRELPFSSLLLITTKNRNTEEHVIYSMSYTTTCDGKTTE
jgi:hypothetical protein